MNESESDSPSPERIKFEGDVDADSIEKILKRWYEKTFAEGVMDVVFDFGRCQFLHPLALSIFVAWAAKLRRANRTVAIERPHEGGVDWFLEQYDVYGFLFSHGVHVPSTRRTPGILQPPHRAQPFYKLVDIDEQLLAQTLSDLADPGGMENVLAPIATSALARSGEIRDVILSELGDNIVKHAESIGGHVFMTKFAARNHIRQASDPETAGAVLDQFERRLDGGDYVVVVVGDAGDGIPATLRKAFELDPENEGRKPGTDAEVLEYAFNYTSTRRTPEERLGSIRRTISPESTRFPPPTGLFRLRDLALRAAGAIYVRSGAGAVVVDYQLPPASKVFSTFDPLTPYDGTTISVFIPLTPPAVPRLERVRIDDSEPAARPMTYLSLGDYVKSAAPLDLDASANALHDLFEALKKVSGGTAPRDVVVNLKAAPDISSKALHYVIFELAQRQVAGPAIVLVQVPGLSVSDAKAALIAHRHPITPIIAFDDHYVPHLIGADADCERLFELIRRNQPLTDPEAALAREYPTIFVRGANKRWLLRFGEHNIRTVESKSFTDTLAKAIDGTFRSDARVLLPSAAYADGFFELAPRMREPAFFNLVTDWLRAILPEMQPEVIVSLGATCADATKAVIGDLPQKPRHLPLSLAKGVLVSTVPILDFLARSARKDLRYVVFVDVIATGKTIARVLHVIGEAANVQIVTLVDTRSPSDDALRGDYRITAITKRAIAHYLDELPRTWLYSDIRLVDPFTHALLDAQKTDGPLWQSKEPPDPDKSYQTNAFLEEAVVPANAFRVGHFAGRDRHLTFMFDVARLGDLFRTELAERIHRDISNRAPIRPITHVVIPQSSRAMGIARAVGALTRHAQIVEISPDELRTPFGAMRKPIPEAKTVLVCDAVLDSGRTVNRLVEIAASLGPTQIEVIAVVGRGNLDRIRRLQKNTRYDHVDVHLRCVGEIELPTYSPAECPLCHYRQTWERVLRHTSEGSLLRQLLVREMHALEPRSLEQAWADKAIAESNPIVAHRDALRLEYRWRVEAATRNPLEKDHFMAVLGQLGTEHALALMTVIVRERLYQRMPAEIRSIVFPEKLVTVIRRYIAWMIKNSAFLWIDDFQTLLYAIDEYSEGKAPDHYLQVGMAVQRDPERLELLILHCLRSGLFHGTPVASRDRLEALDPPTAELQRLVAEAASAFDSIHKGSERQLQSGLEATRELLEGLFHDLSHRLELIQSGVSAADTTVLVNDFAYLQERLDLIFTNSRIAARACHSRDTRRNLEDLIKTAEADLRDAKRIVSRLRARRSETEPYAGLRRTAEILVERCKELHEELTYLAVPLDTLLQGAVNAHRRIAELRGIHLDQTPIPSCWVYGERGPIFSMLSNIVKNAAMYSKTEMQISVVRDREANKVQVVVKNDGAVSDPPMYGAGLDDVVAYAARYAAEFRLRDAGKRKGARKKILNVVATLSLNVVAIDRGRSR